MGSMAAEMAAAGEVEMPDGDADHIGGDPTGVTEIKNPQEILDMLGDQPITPEMLKVNPSILNRTYLGITLC